jgi:type IV pilus assembly protein PilM
MVQLRRDGDGYVVTGAGVTDIEPWGDDPQLRKIHTVRAILDGLSNSGINGKYAVCGLRGPEVVVRGFEFPALPPEEIEGAVQLEVSQICPFLAEESTLDYQATSCRDTSTMGFWVAATNGLVENTRQIVSGAGLRCALVDVAGLALLNLLAHQDRQASLGREARHAGRQTSDETSPAAVGRSPLPAVLHVSDSGATIAIADPAGRPFVRDIGCSALVDSQPPLAAARAGFPGSLAVEDGWAARRDCQAVTYDSLVEDVTTTLRYYAAQNGSTRVDRLLVCGGGAAEPSVELLREKLNLDILPWNPLAECGWQDPSADPSRSEIRNPHLDGSTLAVAAGLAMRHV